MIVGDCAQGLGVARARLERRPRRERHRPRLPAVPRLRRDLQARRLRRKLVRYYEDSTLVAVTIAPTTPGERPRAADARHDRGDERAAASTCSASTSCCPTTAASTRRSGAGRPSSPIATRAPARPSATTGAGQAAYAPNACRPRAARPRAGHAGAVVFAAAGAACADRGARFDVPRTGYENARLHALAGASATWIDQGPPSRVSVRCGTRARRARCVVRSATGTPVSARLLHGGKTVARAAATVRRGRATVSFRPRLRRGRYVVRATVGATTVTRRLRLR